MYSGSHILVVDDEESIRESMCMLLRDRYKLHIAQNGREAIEIVRTKHIDLVLLDIHMPEVDGLEVLKIIKDTDENVEVIMVTAVMMVGKAVEAMRHGAYDYITKPFDIAALEEQVKKALEKRRLLKENFLLRQLIDKEGQFEKIIGKSPAIQNIFSIINDVANSLSTVLISGESGTGKELVARAIHNRSPRSSRLFVPVNCAAIPDNLLESELFGHERGSFTGAVERQIGKFEIASGGTLFLDEISTLPLSMQAKLLRALQEKEIQRIGASRPVPVDTRIIAATNTDPLTSVKEGKLREDLYYRLNVIPVDLPPLRERQEDIELLINHFLHKYCREFNKKIKGLKNDALQALKNYAWPGNIRELENLMERLVVLNKQEFIERQQLPLEMQGPSISNNRSEEQHSQLAEAVRQFEADFIQKALQKAGGKKGQAAKLLGIHRNTLMQLEKKFVPLSQRQSKAPPVN